MRKAFIFLFFCISAAAQNISQDGWVILNNGNKIKGKIKFTSNKKAHKKCVFVDQNLAKTIYFPQDIQSYGFDNFKEYRSHIVLENEILKPIFLEKMVDGVVDLYFYKSKSGESFFLEKKGELISLKASEDSTFRRNGQFIQNRVEPFKYILYNSFYEAPNLLNEVNKLKYDQSDLVNIFTKYHNATCDSVRCIDYTAIIKNQKKITFEAGAIFLNNTYTTSKDKYSYTSPYAGLLLKINTAKSGYRNYFKTGIQFGQNEIKERYLFLLKSNFERYIDINEKYSHVSLPLVIGKSKNIGKANLNYDLGIINHFFIFKDYGFKLYNIDFFGNVNEQYQSEKISKKPYKAGIEAGIGLQKGRLNIGCSAGIRTTIPRFGFYSDFVKNSYVIPKIGIDIN